jgi:hypothetical protein
MKRDLVSFLKKLPVWSMNFLLGLIFIFTLQYFKIKIFFKEKNTPFSGDYFYNPYKDFSQNTLKANFHTHSKSRNNSVNNPNEKGKVFEHYKNNGYDIVSLSDYQKISEDQTSPEYIPVYEHGYNLRKSHQLVINSKKVTFFDFSIFQNFNTKQQVINKLRLNSGLIALAHPDLWGGYTEEEMDYLKGYDFIEVFSNYQVSANIWDAALTSGYPAWLLADDDCHDISRLNHSFNNWNRIGSASPVKEEIISTMKRGCYYGVRNLKHNETNFLDSCVVHGKELRVYFKSRADRITFISDNGSTRKEVHNVAEASYLITKNDSYVRVEAKSDDELIYLNPVIRYNGYQLSYNTGFPLINTALTLLFRFLVLLLSLSILFIILLLNGRVVIPAQAFKPVVTIRTRGEVSLG